MNSFFAACSSKDTAMRPNCGDPCDIAMTDHSFVYKYSGVKDNVVGREVNDLAKRYTVAPQHPSFVSMNCNNTKQTDRGVDTIDSVPSSPLYGNHNHRHSDSNQKSSITVSHRIKTEQQCLTKANVTRNEAPSRNKAASCTASPDSNFGCTRNLMLDVLNLNQRVREIRNRAEKNRRDKLNGLVQQLASMVPHVAASQRRVDKTGILRFAAHGLRLRHVFGNCRKRCKSKMLMNSLTKLVDGFLIALTCDGQIVLVSSEIEEHLGHCQTDLYGSNILQITHSDDHHVLKRNLVPSDLESLSRINHLDDRDHKLERHRIAKRLRKDRRHFIIRLARAGPKGDNASYVMMKFNGSYRLSDGALQRIKSRLLETYLNLNNVSGNDIIFIAMARVVQPSAVIDRVMEVSQFQYRTRHLMDGRIIDCDQRIGIVAGYLRTEVLHLSPFKFMHEDDAPLVITALNYMFKMNNLYGESTYRLKTRTGSYVFLTTRGFMEMDRVTNTPCSFVCVNTLLDEEEGRRRQYEMQRLFGSIIDEGMSASVEESTIEELTQREGTVEPLLESCEGILRHQEEPNKSPQNASALESVEGSVNNTFDKYLPDTLDLIGNGDGDRSTISVLNSFIRPDHVMELMMSEAQNDNNEVNSRNSLGGGTNQHYSERTFDDTEVNQLISSSLDQIECTLNNQLNTTIELHDQSQRFCLPIINQHIEEIMEEHKCQKQYYENLKREYECKIRNNNVALGNKGKILS